MNFRRKHRSTGVYSFSFKRWDCTEFVDCKLQLKIFCFWVTIRKYSINVNR